MTKTAYFVCANCGQEYLADWYITYEPKNGSQFSVAYTDKKFCSRRCSEQHAITHSDEFSPD